MNSWSGIDEFLAVAQTRSFTQAARRVGRSTSQVSREIASLEDRLGQRLFYRTTRYVSLTDVGERFMARCRRLSEERDEIVASLLDEATSAQGLLRVTCSVAYGEHILAPHLNAFMREHERVSVDLIMTDEILDLVDQGIDLAIRSGQLRDSRLVATRLASRTRHLCASPQYLERFGVPLSMEHLADHTCIRGTADIWRFRQGKLTVEHRPQGRLRCNSGQAALAAALEGLGICRLPDFYVQPHFATGALVELLPDFRPPDEGVWAVYPERRHLPLKVKALISHLQSQLGRTSHRGITLAVAGPQTARGTRD